MWIVKARRLRQQIAGTLLGRSIIDLTSGPGDVVFVAGSARSGTTWVSEIINYRNDHRLIFEPFHPLKVEAARAFANRQYLRPENRDPRLIMSARTMLTGRFRNSWADSRNRRLVARRRLIKDVRTNLMLKWLHANFAGMRIAFVLRHPCAVASSRMKLGWGAPLERLLSQEDLVEDHLRPFANEIGRAQDPFDRQVFMWCIENYVPLRQFRRGEVQVVFYEALCSDPVREIGRLFQFLGKPWDARVLRVVGRPSSVTRRDGIALSGGALADIWRRDISDAQIRRAVSILGLFGLDSLYSGGSNPQGDALPAYGGELR